MADSECAMKQTTGIEGCWASSLGNCGGGISREHYVSQCVFPNQSIFVQGLDWCLEKPKEHRIETLTAKILCRDHNSALSELDSEAGRAFGSIREFARIKTEREKMPYINWAFKQLTIDSRKLERWCLKSLLNFSFGRNLIIGPGSHKPGSVPAELARIAFGLEEFTDGRGIYTAYKLNETFNFDDHFNYIAKAHESHLVMGLFRLCGFRFYLNLFHTEGGPLAMIEDSHVFYRTTHFNQAIGSRLSHRLTIV
jgi:hypothetical protein